MKIYNFLMKQYTWGRRKLILCCILQLVLSAGTLINAEIMRRGTSAIQMRDMGMLTNASILLVIVIVLNIVCAFVQKMYRRQSGLLYQEQLQRDILWGALDSDRETRAGVQTGGMLTMMIRNAEDAVESSMDCLMEYAAGILGIGVCTVYMLLIDWRITLVIILFQVLVRVVLRRLDRGIKTFSEKVISATKESTSLIVEILSNMLTVRSSGQEDFFNERAKEHEERLYRLKTTQHFLRLGKDDLVWAATSFSEYVIMYGLGGVLVCLGGCQVSMVLALAFVIGPFVKGVNELAYASSDKIEALANIDSVKDFLGKLQAEREDADRNKDKYVDENECRKEAKEAIGDKGENVENTMAATPVGFAPVDNSISIRDLHFAYDDQEILHGICLEIAPGETVELRGASGSGKSTLLSLLTGVQKSSPGTILIGGQDVAFCSFDQLSQGYCYISQKSYIFAGSLCENLAMSSSPDMDLCRKILKVLNLAGCEDKDPFLLSQGEKQRVNIGRAFYRYAKKRTKLLFCDEIFANLDQENADDIAQSLAAYFQGCTVLFVSHQDIDIPFDRVLNMADGRLETV